MEDAVVEDGASTGEGVGIVIARDKGRDSALRSTCTMAEQFDRSARFLAEGILWTVHVR
jgi:hypothetical protein